MRDWAEVYREVRPVAISLHRNDIIAGLTIPAGFLACGLFLVAVAEAASKSGSIFFGTAFILALFFWSRIFKGLTGPLLILEGMVTDREVEGPKKLKYRRLTMDVTAAYAVGPEGRLEDQPNRVGSQSIPVVSGLWAQMKDNEHYTLVCLSRGEALAFIKNNSLVTPPSGKSDK